MTGFASWRLSVRSLLVVVIAASLLLGGLLPLSLEQDSNNTTIRGYTYGAGRLSMTIPGTGEFTRRALQPFHIHMERARGGITFNPSGRSWRMWGNWQ